MKIAMSSNEFQGRERGGTSTFMSGTSKIDRRTQVERDAIISAAAP